MSNPTVINPLTAEQCLRDLAWLLTSPPLLSLAPQAYSATVQRFTPEQTQAINAWLLQQNGADLLNFILQAQPTSAPMRLGRYAERLMLYFFSHCALLQLIAANVPLRQTATDSLQTHTTLGEFDFLLTDNTGTHWHWELAVKFYLYHPSATTAAKADDFKGPAGKDTLALKLNKMFSRQLQHQPPAPYQRSDWQPAAYARGWLFYPFEDKNTLGAGLNPQHGRGWWENLDSFTQQRMFDTDSRFVHLPRLFWLSRYEQATKSGALTLMTHAEMSVHLQNFWRNADTRTQASGQLIAELAPQGERWVEVSRGFVLPK